MRLRTAVAVVALLAIASPAVAGIRWRVIRWTPHEAPAAPTSAFVAQTESAAPISVPEPSTLLLTGLGLGALRLFRRRQVIIES